jgi:hypothetical protein
MRSRRLLAHFCLAVWLFLAGAGVALYRVDECDIVDALCLNQRQSMEDEPSPKQGNRYL